MNVKIIKSYMGWGAVFLLSVIPVILWIFQEPLSQRFFNATAASYNLGRIAGLTGMAMFSIMVILSARLKIFEKFFWGINEAYVVHHFYGGIAFSLLLFHPLLLAMSFLQASFRQAALFLLPSAFWPQNFGIFALLTMIIVLVTTFYAKEMMKYQNWKLIHQFMGLAFVFAFFHVFFIGSDIALNPVLKIYMFFLAILAIAAYLYRTVFGNLLVRRYDYVIGAVRNLPDNTYEVTLTPVDKALYHQSGQFVFIKLKSKALSREVHPFTISSAPGEKNLRLSIKESGDWTKNIKNLQMGDKVKIEGPYGKFNFRNYGKKKQIWIAGGIGLAPFLSMMRDLKETDKDYDIIFYYSVKNENGFIFSDEIKEISQKNGNLKTVFWRTDINGFLSAGLVAKETPDFLQRDILICGPYSLMSVLKEQFLKLGVKKSQIHTEEFQL